MSDDYFLKLKRNQIKMIKHRGYDVSDEEWILEQSLTGKSFKKKLIEKFGDYVIRKLLFSEYTHPQKSRKLFVYYINIEDGKQIKVETVKSFIYKMTGENKDGIVVVDSIISPTASECLNMITEHYYQIFKEEELIFNVTEHINYNQHIQLTERETNELRKKGVSAKGLMWITQTDPIVKYFGFNPGSFIKIIVKMEELSLISDTYNNYRVVV